MNIDPASKLEQDRQRKMRRASAKIRETVRSTIKCIQCGALPGEYCRTTTGGRRIKMHAIRWSTAKNGKAAQSELHDLKTDAIATYATLPPADIREPDPIRIKKRSPAFNPSA